MDDRPAARLCSFNSRERRAQNLTDLLTWNCTHIANAVMRAKIESVCRRHAYEPPTICTPQELMEG
jgi:hypothetical protein